MKPSAVQAADFVQAMDIMRVLPETGRLKSHSTGSENEVFTHCNNNKKTTNPPPPQINKQATPTQQTITTFMTTLGERGLLSHPSVFAVSCLLFELCFSLLFSLKFNFPKGWIDPTYFLLTVSLESHSIGQAELFTFMLMYPSNTKMSEFYCILLTPFLFFSLQGLSVKAAFRNKDLGLVLKER